MVSCFCFVLVSSTVRLYSETDSEYQEYRKSVFFIIKNEDAFGVSFFAQKRDTTALL